ncbi:MAG: type II toxin-antitoxin system RelE/ParE family toxin [Casimicrobiaceae bacterium]
MAYAIEIARSVVAQIEALNGAERAQVLDGMEKQLAHEPLRETRNRKPLRPNPIAPWELRLGSLRVFYDVSESGKKIVHVLAVGKKVRNTVRIAGQEIKL